MKTYEVVIIGAGYAGMMTAYRLAKKTKRQQVKISVINAKSTFEERLRNHQIATKQTVKLFDLREMLQPVGVDFVQGMVMGIQPDTHEVLVKTDATSQIVHYDRLIYALRQLRL